MTTLSSLLLFALLCSAFLKSNDNCEIIDLGYAKHVPTWTNTTSRGTKLLNYNNIRYAQPPLGNLRFRKPRVPPTHQPGIQHGNMSSWETDCLSSAPFGVPFPLLSGSSWGSEDCLFLNVIKPKHAREGDKLPVLHWIVGSAFAFGGKDWTGFGLDTYGLYNRPLDLPDDFIVVTHNYRLGIPGWTPKLGEDMNGNIGVWDSLAAIEWTKQHIQKFGGDPAKITVFGQSAGAAIITYMLLGKNGTLDLPFDTAWIASPTIPPRRNLERYRVVWNSILNATDCVDVDCMRAISEDKLKRANRHVLLERPSGPGGGGFGPGVGLTPSVDGELLSDLPVRLIAQGKFNKGIKRIVVGNTANEGLGTSSDSDMPNRFPLLVRANIPGASDKAVEKLEASYTYPVDTPERLAWDLTTDMCWSCMVENIARAYGSLARRYLFSIPPATHGNDLTYFFFPGNETMPMPTQANIDVAYAAESMLLQYMFRENFTPALGAPFAKQLSQWPVYSSGQTVANITLNGFEFGATSKKLDRRCLFINTLLQDPENGV